MRQLRWASWLPIVVIIAAPASAAVVKILNTGVDDATSLRLNNNQSDLDFVIAPGSSGGHVGEIPVARATPLPNGWLADSASTSSRWIVLNTGVGQEGVSVGPGNYIFQTTFNFAGFDPTTASIPSLRYAADNKLVTLRVNGTIVFSQDSTFAEEFRSFIQLAPNLGSGLFQPGLNTVSFEVMNQAGLVSPMGLRVEALVTAQVPEPFLAGAPLGVMVGLVVAARRTRSRPHIDGGAPVAARSIPR
jgi:hypothetical protein